MTMTRINNKFEQKYILTIKPTVETMHTITEKTLQKSININ